MSRKEDLLTRIKLRAYRKGFTFEEAKAVDPRARKLNTATLLELYKALNTCQGREETAKTLAAYC